MSLSPSTFASIAPSRYITFTLPIYNDDPLQVSVLDSPSTTAAAAASTAAMWIPHGRESDWIFSTFSGHLQLLLSCPTTHPLSRLILLGNSPSYPHPTSYNSTLYPSSSTPLRQDLAPLLPALTPKSDGEIPEVPFLIYEDEVVKSSILEICEGFCVGQMLIENVELEYNGVKEFRRRLRFKRMPNFVQTQMRIYPKNESKLENLDNMEFELDKGVLVQPYLKPMVAGMFVISRFLEGRIRPKALCLGVGGGALLGFLNVHLNFEVVGVEEDEVVIEVAKKYFGLNNDELVHLFAEDGIEYVTNLAKNVNEESRFDVVMVDLDSSDVTLGVCAPPVEFVRKSVLMAVREVVFKEGVVVINTIPSSKLFHDKLIYELENVFEDLYEIDVGNGENFVLIATKMKIESALDADEGAFLNKLKRVVSRYNIKSIRKILKTGDLQASYFMRD